MAGRLLAALLAGGLVVPAFAPGEAFPLAPLSLAALWALLARAASRRAGLLTGLAWGLGAFLGGVSWLFVALHRYGGMAAPLAGVAILLFCAYLALYPALAGGLFVALRRHAPGPDAALAGALWLLGEWLRGWLFTGFPWLAVGYTQTPPSPLAGWLPVLGVYGVGGLLAGLAAWPVLAGRAWRRPLAGIAAVLLAGWGLGEVAWTRPAGPPLVVALLQTNIDQQLKWDPASLPHWLEHNRALVAAHPAPLVVLPETTLPLLAERLPAGYLADLAAPVRAAGGELILGVFLRNGAGHIHNGALAIGPGPVQQYHKQHLVPFGEYSPPLFHWFYELVHIPMADQTRGAPDQPPITVGGHKIAVNICYEDVFGEELIRALPEATLLLNLSNLAWYGDSYAQPQHLQIARVRALETGRTMLRSTNTGMTAVVRPDGSVQAALPAFETGALVTEVHGHTGLTPYARTGNGPAVALAGAVLAWAMLRRRPHAPRLRSQTP
jgi:apolipoprotein N-acyltransferase